MSNDNHRKFLNHLEQSKGGVWRVSRWLSDLGYTVTVPAISKAATHDEWRQHADGGDLFLHQRVEVKQLSVKFTGASDWPFRSKFIVCAKHAFDDAKPKPFAYVILSADARCAAIVEAKSKSEWYTEWRKDSRYNGVSQEFYFAPMECVKFFLLEADAHEQAA